MKKAILILFLPIILVNYYGIAYADLKRTKIAVLDFTLQGKGFKTEDLGQIVAEWLITALVKEGRFDVIERRLLQKIIAEQQLSETGLLDQETTAQLGKVLGVKAIITGSVMRVLDITEINTRMIDVETGSILAAECAKNTNDNELKNLIEQMTQKIIKAFPIEGYIINRQDDRVTLDLGRFSGVKKGMNFFAYQEGEVVKHPKTGEILGAKKNQTGLIRIDKVLDKFSEGYILKETNKNSLKSGHLVKSSYTDLNNEKGALFINTVPIGSDIQIMNIKPKYYRGIGLVPGNYHIKVSAPSYQVKSQWIQILPGEKKIMSIALIKKKPPEFPDKQLLDNPPKESTQTPNRSRRSHQTKPGNIKKVEPDCYPFDDKYLSRNRLMEIKDMERQRDTAAQNIMDTNSSPQKSRFNSTDLEIDSDNNPISLSISPATKTVQINELVTLKATLKMEDGSTKDVSKEVSWNPGNPFKKGTIGEYTVKATINDLTGTATITVIKK